VRHTWTLKCRELLMMLPNTLLVASLAGCSILHTSGEPSDTPLLKGAVDAAAETAVGVATDSKYVSTQNAWRDRYA
jgi:hypothetical protein